jgi:hypothetical protein
MKNEKVVSKQAVIAVLQIQGDLQTRLPSLRTLVVIILFSIELQFKYF